MIQYIEIIKYLSIKIYFLNSRYNALVFIDECHATGFLGETGRGTEEYFGMKGRVDIINSTLGKALGGAAGGYTTGNKELISLLRQRARPYLFSNSLPPPVVACASQVKIDIKFIGNIFCNFFHIPLLFIIFLFEKFYLGF